MGKRDKPKARKETVSANEADQAKADKDMAENPPQETDGVTARYVGDRILFYIAGGNPIIEGVIRNYLLDHRFGMMCLGLGLGSLFSQWLNSLFPPPSRP